MEPYPASPEPEHRPGPSGPAPTSVQNAVKLIWAGVGVGLVSTVLAFMNLDTYVDQAVESTASSVEISRDVAQTSVVVGIVISAIISVGLAALFAYFIGKGANWARIVYTVLGVVGLLFSLPGLGNQPGFNLVLSLVGMVLTVASIVLLFRPESNAFFKRA